MLQLRFLVAVFGTVLFLATPASSNARPTAQVHSAQETFTGSWQGEYQSPFDPKPLVVRFGIEPDVNGNWRGGFQADTLGTGLLSGRRDDQSLELVCDFGGPTNSLRLTPDGKGGIAAVFTYEGMPIPLAMRRTSAEWTEDLRFEVKLTSKRPMHVTLAGLPDFWLPAVESTVVRAMDSGQIVGLGLAIVVDGELLDSRAWGWSDVESNRAVNGQTLFRWASISKTITGVVATKLATTGVLNLDTNVSELVVEYPKKQFPISTRQVLGHLGGIVHYQHEPELTRRDYGVEFPFRDPIRALDVFSAAPLIHEPGSGYSYSTHGFVLVGAVIERVSEHGYLEEVRRLVSGPLEMTTLEPDDPGAPNPARTTGYRRTSDGRLLDAGDSNIAWKLAGGGFQSTVSDLGRFGAALSDGFYLDEAQRKLLFESQQTADGRSTGYSMGLNISRVDGSLFVSHGGAQTRTRTFLLCAPDRRLAVALMCNTEGSNLMDIGQDIMRILLGG